MITRFTLLLTLLLVVRTATGETLKLETLKVGSTTYSNVTVLGANATDIYFSHSLGFANVKLKYLGTNLQHRFNYNPRAAEEAERAQAANDILYQTALAADAAAQPGKGAPGTPKPSLGSETGLADPVSDKSLLGKPGPKLEVEKWLGEKPALEGKYVLVSFWAPWSAPCRQSIPEFNALQKKYAERLVILGITSASETDVSEMSEPRIEFATALDPKAKLSAASGVTSIPCVLLLDPKGTVLYEGHPGAVTDKKLQAILVKPQE